jgi:hypothetical protein
MKFEPITTVEAEQITKDTKHITLHEDGVSVSMPWPISRSSRNGSVCYGSINARIGDWIVIYPDGSQSIFPDEYFKKTYKPMKE